MEIQNELWSTALQRYFIFPPDGYWVTKNTWIVGTTVDVRENDLPSAATCSARPSFPSRLVPFGARWKSWRCRAVARVGG